MTTLLQTYEEEYRDAVKSVNDELAALRATLNREAAGYKAPPSTGPGSRLSRIAAMGALMGQLRELLGSMDYECNDLPVATRQTAKERIAEYRASIRKLEDSISKAKTESSGADRADLIGAGANSRASRADGELLPEGELDNETRRHRMTMMDNTDKVRQASNKLTQAERLLNDTEQVGSEALTSLKKQTEQMHNINETTIAVDEEVSEARRILGGMQKMMIKHKLILIAVILVLVLLIIVAVWVGVNKNRNNLAPDPSTVAPVDPIPVTPT